jgi:hypothetical protein
MTMTRRSRTFKRLARLLRPSPARFAAAAALHDPGLLLALQAARADGERRDAPARGARRRRGATLTSPYAAR